MGVKVKVYTDGFQNAYIRLDGMRGRSSDLGPALDKSGVMMLGSIQRNFTQSGRPAPWTPLSSRTLIGKISRGKSPRPLILSGARGLQGSVSYRYSLTPTGGRLIVGTPVKYARIHQFGGVTHPRVTKKMRGWAWHKWYETGDEFYKGLALTKKTRLDVKIPARKFLMFQKADLRGIGRLVLGHVMGGGK